MQNKFLVLLLFPILMLSQEIKISGTIKDNQNRGIENASVLVYDNLENTLAYTYSDDKGSYNLVFEKLINTQIKVSVASLGYAKKEITIDLTSKSNLYQSFILEEKTEYLKEVVIEANQKIRISRDTTTIKVASFSNKTEQTVEDILKKLPGIEVQKDGSIKAHGKTIDKLLIEGEDLFDKNYKLLTKNLDAKTLDAVQIIDAFEDNPILKKMNNSDKVALNLKLKKDKQNIWFGNILAGAGIISGNRWKEGINLGLLKKKIKLFYLADYNNSGEKATDQVSKSINENNLFGENRYEKTAKTLFTINSNENSSFSKSQSVFNKAFFNSLSFSKKISNSMSLRGVGYFANDNQLQNSFSQTQYNIENTPITYTENNNYSSKKTLSSGELELKYFVNDDNYLTNIFIYKNNPSTIYSELLFNQDDINQASKDKNQTFYNHFNHTYRLSDNKVLHNYFYFGKDNINQNNKIESPFLNSFLNLNPESIVVENADNSNSYFGLKSKMISRFKKLEYTLGLQFENSKEIINNTFFENEIHNTIYENNTVLKQNQFSLENNFRYNLTQKLDATASLNTIQNQFSLNGNTNSILILNPLFSINLKKTEIGNFTLSYSENNKPPEINYLNENFLLSNYKTFEKGTKYEGVFKNKTLFFSHNLYNDVKRFSIGTSLFYTNSKNVYNKESLITNNLSFEKYIFSKGSTNFNGSFNIVNYFRKLKMATKLETIQNWNETPTRVNSVAFVDIKTYSSCYKFSATTYFNLPINFDFGFNYNFYKTNFNSILTKNITKDAFINCNYKISKTCLGEIKSTFYQM
ncbi:carboxypeptidase-like regulatory domain-containing protein, partial [Flavobacterium sp.]|uniref:carboxypeptidase-like regulatory domain-containing protein n=1 Tax=Flavobacterium sp. TaxID=239 RepID=UPI0038FCC24A